VIQEGRSGCGDATSFRVEGEERASGGKRDDGIVA
jgi:hypothetical protein